MNPIIKNILGVISGIIIGGIVNWLIIFISPNIVPPPEGVDVTSIESIKANIDAYRPVHFLFPLVAHALGSFLGAFIAAKIAARRPLTLSLIVGTFFLIGGTSAVMQIGEPMWFIVLDLTLAYIPMAYLGYKAASNS